jgi:myo-inositol-1(or 4)-monophosphatase
VTAQDLVELAADSARRAGALLLERFQRPAEGVDTKSSSTDLVSDADRDAERLVIDLIHTRRRHDGVLGEESGVSRSQSGVEWILDPLDGTVNFLFGIPVWSVSIAARDPDGMLLGIVYDPTRDEMYSAVRGGGASLNGSSITVSERASLDTALIGTGFSYDPAARAVQARVLTRVLPQVRDIRRAGSAALDLASVACGRLDGVFEAPMEPWDKAAGALLVQEAGGVVSDLPPPLDHLSPGVVCANGALHDKLRALVLASSG